MADFKKIPYFITNSCEDEVFPEELLGSFVEKLTPQGHKNEGHFSVPLISDCRKSPEKSGLFLIL